jgi:Tol biopolymer transport system component
MQGEKLGIVRNTENLLVRYTTGSMEAVCIGKGAVDRAKQLVSVDGVAVALPHRTVLVLFVLMDANGQVVSKEELLSKAWDGEFVDESNLTQAIAKLRKVLGPEAIVTVPRLGYRLIPGQRPEAPKKWGLPRRFIWLAAGCMMLAMIGVAWRRAGSAERTLFVTADPVTGLEGDELTPTVSPDGENLAFAWTKGSGSSDLYLLNLKDRKLKAIAARMEHESGPAFSPEGKRIAYLRHKGSSAKVVVLDLVSGAEMEVAEVPAPHHADYGQPGPFVAWMPDGKGLLFSDRNQPGEPLSIYLLTLEDRKKRQLTSAPVSAARGDSDPAISPDGRRLVFARDLAAGVSELWKLDLNSNGEAEGRESRIVWKQRWNRSPAWSPDGRRIVFASGDWGRVRLWEMDLTNGSEAAPLLVGEDGWNPTFSRQGDLYFSRYWGSSHIWRLALSSPGVAEGEPATVLTSARNDTTTIEAPDGCCLVFENRRAGSFQIWKAGLNGENAGPFIPFRGHAMGTPRYSPDGNWIVFDGVEGTERDLYLVRPDGTGLRRFTDEPGDDVLPRWSPDGKHVYFSSKRSGRFEIWKQAIAGGNAVQVTRRGGHIGEEVAGRPGLYFRRNDERVGPLFWLDAEGGEHEIIPSVRARNFTTSREGIYYLSGVESEPGIRFYDFKSGKSKLVLDPVPAARSLWTVSAGHQRLYYGVQGPQSGDVMVVRRGR